MAYITNLTKPAHPGLIGPGLARIAAAITAWRDARATRAALSQLSDRELDDIGLTRSEIDRVSRNV